MRNKFLLSISICGVLILYTASSSGQEESPGLSNPETLDPVVVTGTAYPAELSKSTGSVTVITGEEIEASHAVSVGELLEQVPGLYVDQPASRGGVTSVYIRGGDPNFTLVLIDGVKVNDPTNSRGGSFDFSALSTDNIERIEIVRDPMSSLYGSDALSGVINIITKKGEGKPKATAEAMGGRYGQYQFLGGVSGAGPFYDYSVTGSWLDDGEQVEGSTFKSPSVTASLGLINRDDMEITSTFRYSHIDSTSFPDDSGGPEFAVLRTTDDRNIDQLLLGLGYTHSPALWWEYGIKLSFYNTKEKFSSPGVAPGERDPFGIPPNEADSDYKNYDANITSTFSPYEGVDIVAGFEAEFQDGSSRGMILGDFPLPAAFDLSRYILSPYLEVQFGMVENLYIVLGAREDFPEGFDPAFSPRAGVSYKIAATDTILRGSWGEGFKLPSFFSLANPIVGNPDLVPEESRSLDLGNNPESMGRQARRSVQRLLQRVQEPHRLRGRAAAYSRQPLPGDGQGVRDYREYPPLGRAKLERERELRRQRYKGYGRGAQEPPEVVGRALPPLQSFAYRQVQPGRRIYGERSRFLDTDRGRSSRPLRRV